MYTKEEVFFMKKCTIVAFLLVISIGFLRFNIVAEEYQNYQEIVFASDDAKLLKDYTDSEIDTFKDQMKKRKFMGWKIDVINHSEEVEFVSETKLKIYNNGFSTIKHDISLTTKEETKFQLSASGGIKVKVSGNVKKFKGTVDADIKASVSYSSITSTTETYDFEIVVDPLTYVKIITRGQGIINNGIGKYYFFWINTTSGCWETFTVTTEYYEIIKDRI